MRAVGVREIKNKLSEYLRLVRNGESVLITDHDRVIAQLAPPPRHLGMPHESAWEALERLQAQGVLRAARGEIASLDQPPLPSPPFAVDIGQALAEVRADERETGPRP